MEEAGVPTARLGVTRAACEEGDGGDGGAGGTRGVVLKADGLAAGKGVIVADDRRAGAGGARAIFAPLGDGGATRARAPSSRSA